MIGNVIHARPLTGEGILEVRAIIRLLLDEDVTQGQFRRGIEGAGKGRIREAHMGQGV
jgi:hypothetical protein